MKRVVVRYKVRADRVEENEALIRRVFDQLAETAPPGVRYCSLKLADGASFMHILETGAGDNLLTSTSAFKAFVEGIRDRCVDPPVSTEFTAIGAYRLFSS
jgi:hypothetical protein